MKIIIQDIPQRKISPETIRCLNQNGIEVCYKGNKIDLEIDDQELTERILLEVIGGR